MKYGINIEAHAKAKFCFISEPGMTVLSSNIYISATADMEINCSCHDPGLAKIKCPARLIGKKASQLPPY